MKPVQILLLVIAGALSGVVITRLWQRPTSAPATAQVRPAPVEAAPRSVAPPAAPEPAASPVQVEKPSPVASSPAAEQTPPVAPRRETAPALKRRETPAVVQRRETAKWQRSVKTPPPPPANPRPIITTARVEPPVAAKVPAPPQVQERPVESVPVATSEPAHVTTTAPPPPAPAPTPVPNQVTLNADVLLPVRLVDGLNSDRNLPGDTFTATLDHELVIDGWVIAERGSRVEGRVSSVDRGGKVKGTSTMAIELTRLRTADGQTVQIETDPFERQAEASHHADAAKVGGAAAVGAIIGAIAGGGKGAAIGAGVGGGAGAGDVLLTRGKPVAFPSETRISFRVRTPVTITERK